MLKVTLLRHTPDPDECVATAARLCYSAKDIESMRSGLDRAQIEKLINKLLTSGHATPFEHASFTFGIEGVSRTATHQLVRHRIASFSQQSQRYVTFENREFIMPPTAGLNEQARLKLLEHYESAFRVYSELIELGIPKEDARYALPEGSATKIVTTMNAREMFHFFRLRCCNRAQWEIRAAAIEMLRLARNAAPVIFSKAGPSCVGGKCPEGSFSCGKITEVREFFENLCAG